MKEDESFFGLNNFLAMGSAKDPLIRTIPIPLTPSGVEMAAIVSSFPGENPTEEVVEEPLFKGSASSLLFAPGRDDHDFL